MHHLENSRYSLWILDAASFLETIIVPIPVELVLVPFMALNRKRIWWIASVAMAGCVLAATLGYGIGIALYESVGNWFISAFDYQQADASYRSFFREHGFVAILVVGILPIPFQLAMLTAGAASYPLGLFLAATTIARGLRYFGLAWLACRFGEKAQEMWQQHSLVTSLAAAAAAAAAAAGVVVVIAVSTRYQASVVL